VGGGRLAPVKTGFKGVNGTLDVSPRRSGFAAYEPDPVLGAEFRAAQAIIPPGRIAMKNRVVALPVRIRDSDSRPFALYGIGATEGLQPLGFGCVHTLSGHLPADSADIRPIADLDELEPASLPALFLRLQSVIPVVLELETAGELVDHPSVFGVVAPDRELELDAEIGRFDEHRTI